MRGVSRPSPPHPASHVSPPPTSHHQSKYIMCYCDVACARHALFTPERCRNCDLGGWYVTPTTPVLSPTHHSQCYLAFSQHTPLEEALSNTDQTLYARLDTHSLALCSDVTGFLCPLMRLSPAETLLAQPPSTSLSHQGRYTEERRSTVLYPPTLQVWTPGHRRVDPPHQRIHHFTRHLAVVKV